MIHYYNCSAFIILVLFTVPFHHFLFSRYLDLTERHFSLDILVHFQIRAIYAAVSTSLLATLL